MKSGRIRWVVSAEYYHYLPIRKRCVDLREGDQLADPSHTVREPSSLDRSEGCDCAGAFRGLEWRR